MPVLPQPHVRGLELLVTWPWLGFFCNKKQMTWPCRRPRCNLVLPRQVPRLTWKQVQQVGWWNWLVLLMLLPVMLCGASLDRCPLSRRKWSISLGCEPQIGDCLISRSLNILRKLPPDLSSSHGSCGNCCLCNRWWTCIFKGDGGIVEPLNWICRNGFFPQVMALGPNCTVAMFDWRKWN